MEEKANKRRRKDKDSAEKETTGDPSTLSKKKGTDASEKRTSSETAKKWTTYSDAFEAGPLNVMTNKTFTSQYTSILEKRKKLPVHLQKEEFLSLVDQHQMTVLVGETGSGKTTQYTILFLLHCYSNVDVLLGKTDDWGGL